LCIEDSYVFFCFVIDNNSFITASRFYKTLDSNLISSDYTNEIMLF